MNEQKELEIYSAQLPLISSFTDRLKELISELLQRNRIKVHLIEARTKSIESFGEKIRRPGKSYRSPIDELPDLSGVRVIVYYQDEVKKVADVLSTEFEIVELEHSHQPSKYSPDQFGYISLHYVIKLNELRLKLPEWEPYQSNRAEVQIRTVLQHSWAAVSHALQYKHESDVPKELRRKLFRLAGLFELADEEFVAVRDTTAEIRSDAAAALESGDRSISINQLSLSEFVSRWEKLDEVRNHMINAGYIFDDPPFEEDVEEDDYIGTIAYHCERIGIKSIEELLKSVNQDFYGYLQRINPKSEWYVSEAFAIFLILIRANIDNFTVEDLVGAGWNSEIAEKVISGALADAKKSG